jgi:hypothetical protein
MAVLRRPIHHHHSMLERTTMPDQFEMSESVGVLAAGFDSLSLSPRDDDDDLEDKELDDEDLDDEEDDDLDLDDDDQDEDEDLDDEDDEFDELDDELDEADDEDDRPGKPFDE